MYKCRSRLLKYQYCTLWLQALNILNQYKNHTDFVYEDFFRLQSIYSIFYFLNKSFFTLVHFWCVHDVLDYSYSSLHFIRILRITNILTKSTDYFTCKCFRCCLVLLERDTF